MIRVLSNSSLPGPPPIEIQVGRHVAAVALGKRRHEIGARCPLIQLRPLEGVRRIALVVAGDQFVVEAHRGRMHGMPIEDANRLAVDVELDSSVISGVDVGRVGSPLFCSGLAYRPPRSLRAAPFDFARRRSGCGPASDPRGRRRSTRRCPSVIASKIFRIKRRAQRRVGAVVPVSAGHGVRVRAGNHHVVQSIGVAQPRANSSMTFNTSECVTLCRSVVTIASRRPPRARPPRTRASTAAGECPRRSGRAARSPASASPPAAR